MEKVLILLKPDCLERRLEGVALEWLLRQTDLDIRDVRTVFANYDKLTEHYAEHAGKHFYDALIGEMVGKRMIAIAGTTIGGLEHVRDAAIVFRSLHPINGPRNLIHCSDSQEAAIRETLIWFPIE